MRKRGPQIRATALPGGKTFEHVFQFGTLGEFVPLGPRAIFLTHPRRVMHVPVLGIRHECDLKNTAIARPRDIC